MPVYEYECDKCGSKFEVLRPISGDDREVKCPHCQAENPRWVISRVAGYASGESCFSAPT